MLRTRSMISRIFSGSLFLAALFGLAILAGCGNDPSGGGNGDGDPMTDTGTPDTDEGPNTIDINGKVVASPSAPVANVQVGLLSGNVTSTDEDGQFQFSDVTPPYDIVTISRDDGAIAIQYRNLERNDPTLFHPGDTQSSDATVEGTISGGLFEESSPPDFDTEAVFYSTQDDESLGVLGIGAGTSIQPNGDYEVQPEWGSDSSVTGRVFALQWETDTNMDPSSFVGYGTSSEITVNDSDMLTEVDVSLDQTVSETSLDVVLDAPEDFDVNFGTILQTFNGTPVFGLRDVPGSNFELTLPDADPLGANIWATVQSTGSSSAAAGILRADIQEESSPYNINLPTPPQLSAPANNATNVDSSTQISWSGFSDGAYLVLVSPSSSPSGNPPTFGMVTADTSTTIPNLSSFGVPFPNGMDYSVEVYAVGPISDADSAATTEFLGPINAVLGTAAGSRIFARDFTLGLSDSREFTTATSN